MVAFYLSRLVREVEETDVGGILERVYGASPRATLRPDAGGPAPLRNAEMQMPSEMVPADEAVDGDEFARVENKR